MYNIFHNTCPDYMMYYFQRVYNVHNYSTCSSVLNFYVPKASTHIKKTFYYHGILDWNNLTSNLNLKETLTKRTFKYVIKNNFLMTFNNFVNLYLCNNCNIIVVYLHHYNYIIYMLLTTLPVMLSY